MEYDKKAKKLIDTEVALQVAMDALKKPLNYYKSSLICPDSNETLGCNKVDCCQDPEFFIARDMEKARAKIQEIIEEEG